MSNEEEKIIAFVFKRSGLNEISFSKFYLTLSMDLNWFTPEEAKSFTNNAINKGLLDKKNDFLKPSFDVENTSIPVGFYPMKKPSRGAEDHKNATKGAEFIENMIDLLSKKATLDVNIVNEKINKIVKEKNLIPEVAALLVGKELALDLEDYFNDVEKQIFKESKE